MKNFRLYVLLPLVTLAIISTLGCDPTESLADERVNKAKVRISRYCEYWASYSRDRDYNWCRRSELEDWLEAQI